MVALILMIIVANIYGFVLIKLYYKKKNLNRDVRLQDICPICHDYTIGDDFMCTNCGLNMTQESKKMITMMKLHAQTAQPYIKK